MKKLSHSIQYKRCEVLLLLLTFFVFLLPSAVLAGYVGSEIPVAIENYDQQNPHTIYITNPLNPGQGLWFTVWEDWRNNSTTGADIYGRFIDMTGALCGNEFLISNGTSTQQIGTGDGASNVFPGTLTFHPVARMPITVKATIGAVTQTCTFNTSGVISGASCSGGSINYSTGAISVTFTAPPDNTTPVNVQYVSKSNQTSPRAAFRPISADGVTDDGKIVVTWQDTRPNYAYFAEITNIDFASCSAPTIGTETLISYNPIDSYDYSSLGTVAHGPVIIGYADCGTKSFTAQLDTTTLPSPPDLPVAPGSVTINDGSGQVVADNGQGGLTGSGSGSVNYNLRLLSVSFTSAPGLNPAGCSLTTTPGCSCNGVLNTDVTSDGYPMNRACTAPGLPWSCCTGAGTGNCQAPITVSYDYFTSFPPTIVQGTDALLGRQQPKIAYDSTGDRFWLVWKETRNMLHSFSHLCFPATVGYISGWEFDDSDFVGYVRLDGATLGEELSLMAASRSETIATGDGASTEFIGTLRKPPIDPGTVVISYKSGLVTKACNDNGAGGFTVTGDCAAGGSIDYFNGAIDVKFTAAPSLGRTVSAAYTGPTVDGADIIRNTDTSTERLVTAALTPLQETRTYESFNLTNHPDVSCDSVSTQCLIVWEGERTKQTQVCSCKDNNNNNICDLADTITDTLTSAPYDDGKVHIYGLTDNYVPQTSFPSMKLDSATGTDAHYPSIGFDPITERFLTAWEDLRGGAMTKIYGQLVQAGSGLYNSDFIISYEDLNGDSQNDSSVVNSRQTKPFVSYDPVNQRYFVVWQDGRNGTLSLENLDIYGQKVDAEGSLRGDNFAVFVLPANQYNPTIAYNDITNQFLAVWKDARHADTTIASNLTCSATSGSGGSNPCGSDVYGQRFTLGQPVLTLLNMDNTQLTPALLSGFENPAGSGSVEAGLAATKSFKIRNTGDVTLTITAVDQTCGATQVSLAPYQFDGLPTFPIDLSPAAELTLTVRFAPTTGGSFNECFIINSNGGSPKVNLSGLAIAPTINILSAAVVIEPPTGATYGFGLVNVGNVSDAIFTVKNAGLAHLNNITLNNPSAPFSILSDGCTGQSVAAGATCSITVRFAPTAVSSCGLPPCFTSSFGVNSNDPNNPTLTVNVTGDGNGAPNKSVTPTSIDFGNVQVNQNGTDQTITVTSNGTMALSITSITGPSAPFTIVTNNCQNAAPPAYPFSLAVGSSCTITVRFHPTTSGGQSSSVTITTNAPPAVTVTLSGTGVVTPDINVGAGAVTNPVLPAVTSTDVSPVTVDLGSVSIGSSFSRPITVSNTGTGALTFSGITNPASGFSIAGNTCVSGLAAYPIGGPAPTCTITVQFAPTGSGLQTSSFAVGSNDPDTPSFTVALTGTGTTLPAISVSPNPVAFGSKTTGSSTDVVVTVKNTGTGTLSISTLSGGPSAPFSITSDACTGASVAPGGSCLITVTFAPTSSGAVTSSFVINSNDPAHLTTTVNLSGTGLAPAITASPSTLAFGSVLVGNTKDLSVTVKNSGAGTLIISSLSDPGTAYNIKADSCTGASLAPSGTCVITVTFAPTAPGDAGSTLNIASNDPANPTKTVTLTATGASAQQLGFVINLTSPNIAISGITNSIDFGTVKVGKNSTPQLVTVKNTGGMSLTINSLTVPSLPYRITSNTCTIGKVLAPNATCGFYVTFTPTRTGVYYPAYVTIKSNDPASPSKVTLKGIGN